MSKVYVKTANRGKGFVPGKSNETVNGMPVNGMMTVVIFYRVITFDLRQ